MQKKMQKNAQKMQRKCKKMPKNDSRAGKVAFLEFPGRPRFSGLSRPPRAISPRPRPPHPVFEPALHPEPGDNSSSRQAQKRIPQGKLPCPILLHRRLAFQEFLHLFLVFGAATR